MDRTRVRFIALLCVISAVVLGQDSSELVRQGVEALNNGDARMAVSWFQKAVAAQPTSTLALLHLANAQLAGGPPQTPDDAKRQGEAAAKTLEQVLRVNPNEKLALWNLGILYAMVQQPDRSVAHLEKLVALDPDYPNALTALGTIQTMHARGLLMDAKRQAKLRAEDQQWIADESSRTLLRTAAGSALEEAQKTLQRARAADSRALEPAVFLNLVLRMKAEMADDLAASKTYIQEADRLVRESLILRQQQGPPAKASVRLDANSPPPPFPKPGTPPPPPPK